MGRDHNGRNGISPSSNTTLRGQGLSRFSTCGEVQSLGLGSGTVLQCRWQPDMQSPALFAEGWQQGSSLFSHPLPYHGGFVLRETVPEEGTELSWGGDRPALAALKPSSLAYAQLRGSSYLLGGVNDTQAVAILEEAQHRGEDRENKCSCEVLGKGAENSLIPLSQPCPNLGGLPPFCPQGCCCPVVWDSGIQALWLAPKEKGKSLGVGRIRPLGQSRVAPQRATYARAISAVLPVFTQCSG